MVTGSVTQEKWLVEMGEVAHGIASGIDIISFKGIFRFAIAGALLDHHLDAWESLEHKDGETRRNFMESVLKHAEGRIAALGLSQETIASINRALQKKIVDHISRLA